MDTNELRKASMAVYLATNDESVAKDLSDKLRGAADEIDKLRNHIATRIEIEENRPAKRLE